MTLTRVASPLPIELERLVKAVIACCLDVHTNMGPGLAENVYAAACCVELELKGIPFEREKLLPISYRGRLLCHQRIDIMVDRSLVIEVKSVERIHPVHLAQTVSYLRLPGVRVGLVINFNVESLRHGIRRVVL
jgi:GxxExxY protein